jgi:uncharacterized membrane protein
MIRRLRFDDLRIAFWAGTDDFLRAPRFGTFFTAVYVLGGFIVVWIGVEHVVWLLAASLGFPILAPFAAAGLYEVSRRLEGGEPPTWEGVLGVVWRERRRQLPWVGAIIMIYLLFYFFLAYLIFALFMGSSIRAFMMTSWEAPLTINGVLMVAIQVVVGGVLAFLLYSLTVVSLPLLLDRDLDFVSAMLVSLNAVSENLLVFGAWALLIVVSGILALVPWFLGLFAVLPILGHATWHLYRRTLV